jgi:sterol O-acyltransferase
MYILEKTAATLGTFTLLILIVEHAILPVMPYAGEKSFVAAVLDLAVPFTCCYLLIFFIIFE